jgi:predicted RNA methylase
MANAIVSGSVPAVVGAASVQFALTAGAGERFLIASTTAAWVAIGSNPTAVAGSAGNMYLPPNAAIEIVSQSAGTKVAIIQDAAGGKATLTPVY